MIYRLVSDYGWGDKAWLERGLSESEAIKAFNHNRGTNYKNISECKHSCYYLEEDAWDDEEDWDWMDS